MHMATTLNIVNLYIDFESSDTVSFRFGRRSDHFTEVSLNVCFWYYCHKHKPLEIPEKSKICHFFSYFMALLLIWFKKYSKIRHIFNKNFVTFEEIKF